MSCVLWLDDPYWLRAARFILSLPDTVRYVLAPAEMNHLRRGCLPAAFAYILDPVDCVLVIPKDDVDLLPLSWIEQRDHWKAIYVDEVFAAFRFSAELTGGAAQDPHLPYLYDRAARVMRGEPVRASRTDAAASDDYENRAYALVASASLTGNGGDRLIAAAAARLVREACPDLAVVVADGNPDRLLVANASAVVIGPGGMLFDIDQTRLDLMNLANWFRFGHLAAEYDVPLIGLGLGDQGMRSSIGWSFVETCFASASLITTRDADSTRIMAEHVNCPVETQPDLSVMFGPDIRALSDAPRNRRLITLCGDFRFVTNVAETLDLARRDTGDFDLRFIVQANEDRGAWDVHADALRGQFGDALELVDCREGNPMDFCRAIAASDAVITTRFHGMMVALMAGVDVLVLTQANDKRERVKSEIGNLPWARFRAACPDLRTLTDDISGMIAVARRDPDRAVDFHPGVFDSFNTRLATSLGRARPDVALTRSAAAA